MCLYSSCSVWRCFVGTTEHPADLTTGSGVSATVGRVAGKVCLSAGDAAAVTCHNEHMLTQLVAPHTLVNSAGHSRVAGVALQPALVKLWGGGNGLVSRCACHVGCRGLAAHAVFGP